jgi:hypothetical protein
MPSAPTPAVIDGWLATLGLVPIERTERDGITSWDLLVDGRRRLDIRITVILEPSLALLLWVHYAPPITDLFRISYRKLLRWNDELPFVKFAVAPDERPVLTSELPVRSVDADAFGLTIARLVGVCDLLADESVAWLWPGAKRAPVPSRPPRHLALLDRYAPDLAELVAPIAPAEDAGDGPGPTDPTQG